VKSREYTIINHQGWPRVAVAIGHVSSR